MIRVGLASIILALSSISADTSAAQTAEPERFEVASVRQNTSGSRSSSMRIPPTGMVVLTNATVLQIIQQAYEITPTLARFSVVGGPEEVLSSRFDITARPPAEALPGRGRLMLRHLLAERFSLRLHKETREIPIYALTVAREGRLGPQLHRSNHDCEAYLAARRAETSVPEPRDSDGRPWCAGSYDFSQPGARGVRRAGTLDMLIRLVQGFLPSDRPIVDLTNLTGSFEWTVTFSQNALNPPPDSPVPSILTAFEEQLGLKLEPRRAPLDVLVIDSIEMPTSN